MIMTIPGAQNEIAFWKEFVKTERFRNWCKDEPNPELGEFMTRFIQEHCPKDGKVLDCGSGLVSILYGMDFFLTSTDVLGKEYEKILPVGMVAPTAIAAEELPWQDDFDIVHMRNALDHCQNPAKAYEAMLRAVKPGGYLIIHGFENEATAEHWQGMHQWDVKVDDGILYIKGKEEGAVYDGATIAKTETLLTGKKWMTWIVRK